MDYKDMNAIGIVRLMLTDGVISQEIAEKYFPELKESEDERIRNGLIGYFRAGKCENVSSYHGISTNDILAWLEKQGEHANFRNKIQIGDKVTRNEDGVLVNLSQLKRVAKPADFSEKQGEHEFNCDKLEIFVKGWRDKYSYPDDIDKFIGFAKSVIKWYQQNEQEPVDKVEPKFHEGEWLCENEPNNYARFIQILEIVNVQGKDRYRISRDIHNDEDIVEFDFVEKYYHKFDIKDAKDGDVLAESSCIFMIQKLDDNNTAETYCTLYNDGDFDDGTILYFDIDSTKPATKEQRDQLEKAMADAGYTFDFEKKELKKIEQNHTWSEEDDKNLEKAIWYVEKGGKLIFAKTDKLVPWLKSLKDRYTWKPSEEQMEALWNVYQGGQEQAKLATLYNDLKKLKE